MNFKFKLEGEILDEFTDQDKKSIKIEMDQIKDRLDKDMEIRRKMNVQLAELSAQIHRYEEYYGNLDQLLEGETDIDQKYTLV